MQPSNAIDLDTARTNFDRAFLGGASQTTIERAQRDLVVAAHAADPVEATGIEIERYQGGQMVVLDTSCPEARKAVGASLAMLGTAGRELKQAQAGVRMALEQRKRAQQGSPLCRKGRLSNSRIVLRGAIKRLRRARVPFAAIPVLEPITAAVQMPNMSLYIQAAE